MTARRLSFEHDGHRFDAEEQVQGSAPEAQLRWVIRLDGAPALEFQGAHPYRDEDVRKRVLEWYEIQKPRR